MNRARNQIFYLLTLIFLLSSFGSTFAQTFIIRGSLRNSENVKGLEGVKVYLRGTLFTTNTIDQGKFTFEDIPEGKYFLTISYPGFNFFDKTIEVNKNIDLGNILLDPSTAEGTAGALQKTIRSTNIIALLNERPNMTGGHATIYGIAPKPSETIGDNYLDSEWNIGNILLYRKQELLEGYKIRYNVSSNTFETIKPDGKNIEVMAGSRVQNLVWVDSTYNLPRYFVNGMDFLEDGAAIAGIFEVLVDGELPLMRRTKIVLKKSNYNEALMVGNRDHQLIKRDTYYYLEGKNLIEVPTKRKHFYTIFGEEGDRIKEFVESNELSPKEPSALFQIFTKYNSKFSGFQPVMDQFLYQN